MFRWDPLTKAQMFRHSAINMRPDTVILYITPDEFKQNKTDAQGKSNRWRYIKIEVEYSGCGQIKVRVQTWRGSRGCVRLLCRISEGWHREKFLMAAAEVISPDLFTSLSSGAEFSPPSWRHNARSVPARSFIPSVCHFSVQPGPQQHIRNPLPSPSAPRSSSRTRSGPYVVPRNGWSVFEEASRGRVVI